MVNVSLYYLKSFFCTLATKNQTLKALQIPALLIVSMNRKPTRSPTSLLKLMAQFDGRIRGSATTHILIQQCQKVLPWLPFLQFVISSLPTVLSLIRVIINLHLTLKKHLSSDRNLRHNFFLDEFTTHLPKRWWYSFCKVCFKLDIFKKKYG